MSNIRTSYNEPDSDVVKLDFFPNANHGTLLQLMQNDPVLGDMRRRYIEIIPHCRGSADLIQLLYEVSQIEQYAKQNNLNWQLSIS
tara:strand:- start:119 stop:376 length:258 start_codon:yes stop_codon:yes gene_type:complete